MFKLLTVIVMNIGYRSRENGHSIYYLFTIIHYHNRWFCYKHYQLLFLIIIWSKEDCQEEDEDRLLSMVLGSDVTWTDDGRSQ